jgi:hypothetical protein
MSDGFEYQYWGSATGGDPNADDDGDGAKNVEEAIAGTIPNGPGGATSVFRILSLRPVDSSTLRITWSSVPGKRYQVYFRDSLTSGPGWQFVIPDSFKATGPTHSYDTGLWVPNRFYRVEVLPTQ